MDHTICFDTKNVIDNYDIINCFYLWKTVSDKSLILAIPQISTLITWSILTIILILSSFTV